jgi:hypothetical protein
MTIERKIVVGLNDIKAISLQCEKCEFRVSMSPDKGTGPILGCPHGHEWSKGEIETSHLPPLQRFASSLEKLRILMGQKTLGFKILLEFDEPRD